jgi:hypothetical protein
MMNISLARHAVWSLAAITLLTTACSTATYPTRETARRNTTTELTVTNHNWADMTVYAIRNGSRLRVGTVVSGTQERFTIPIGFDLRSGDIRLEADPVGSNEVFVSEPMSIAPGARVVWKIENHIQLSSYYLTN